MEMDSRSLPTREVRSAERLYLDLMKRSLTGSLWSEEYSRIAPYRPIVRSVFARAEAFALRHWGVTLVRRGRVDARVRAEGRDWPGQAITMIGLRRMDNLQAVTESVLRDGVRGDLVEAGVWRGGAAIFMRAILEAYGDADRTVWVADSFCGLPKPDPRKYPMDAGDVHWRQPKLVASLEEVRDNFARYGLLDDRVRFLKGWFKDTLPSAPIGTIAVLRIDGDMYGSTMEALRALYPRLARGGYVIIDDYNPTLLPGCVAAVADFRCDHQVSEPLERLPWMGAFWRRDNRGRGGGR